MQKASCFKTLKICLKAGWSQSARAKASLDGDIKALANRVIERDRILADREAIEANRLAGGNAVLEKLKSEVSLARPKREERGSFESKFVAVWRPPQAIQEAFNGVSAEHSLVVLTFTLRKSKQAGADGCCRVLAFLAGHSVSM